MNLIERRRGMVNTTESLPNYVSDGLVLWLDGILKGNDNTQWVDLVGGHVFLNENGAIFNTDNVESSGNNLKNTSFSTPDVYSGNATIEVVIQYPDDSGGNVFMPSSVSSSKIAFGFYKPNASINVIIMRSGSSGSFPTWIAPNHNGSFSVNKNNAYRNGVALTSSGNNYWGRSTENKILGPAGTKVYSIRIYNKYLTEEEVLHNLAIDNERFNLG